MSQGAIILSSSGSFSGYQRLFRILLVLPVVLTLSCGVASAHGKDAKLNDRPIIGVLSQKSGKQLIQFGPTYIPASYVKFIESGGARVVPILVNQTDSYYKEMFNSVNGMLFPGGAVDDLLMSGYGRAGKIFYDLAIKSNMEGDYFPVWGTCQGFELMASLAAGKNILDTLKANNENLNISLAPAFAKSRLLGNAPSEVLDALQTDAVAYNYHTYGVSPEIFNSYIGLNSTFTILGTTKTDDGKVFVSLMEAKKFPFYAVQFHPEKPLFEWSVDTNIKHDSLSVRTGLYFSQFLVSEARKSGHSFSSPVIEENSLIYNYPAVYTGPASGYFVQTYFFQ